MVRSADRCVLLRQLLVEPAVGSTGALCPIHRQLEQRHGIVRPAERAQRLPDGIAGEREPVAIVRIPLPRLQRAFERI